MQIIYSNDKSITTIVVDMRDVIVDNKFTPEIDPNKLYEYVQILDLNEIFSKELIEKYGAEKLAALLFKTATPKQLGIDFDDSIEFNYDIMKYFQNLAKKFGMKDKNYFINMAGESIKSGFKCIPIDKPKTKNQKVVDRVKAKYGEIVDEIDVSVPIWESSVQTIVVFKNPDKANSLRYSYGGIYPTKDWWKEFKKDPEKEKTFNMNYIIKKEEGKLLSKEYKEDLDFDEEFKQEMSL